MIIYGADISGSATITGSLTVGGQVTATAFTGAFSGVATTASFAQTASSADGFTIRGSLTGSSALFTGNITAQTLVVQTVTSSVVYSSGSNKFGDELTDVQEMTGSVRITGSLSVNGTSVPTGTGTSGQVAYWTGSGITGESNLFWDAVNDRLGIGTATPQGALESVGLSYFTRTSKTFLINPNYAGSNTHTQLQSETGMALTFATNGDNERMRITSGGNLLVGTTTDNSQKVNIVGNLWTEGFITTYGDSNNIRLFASTSANGLKNKLQWVLEDGSEMNYIQSERTNSFGYGDLIFATRGLSVAERLRITSGGDVGIGTTTPSYKLDVSGTGRFSGDVTINSSTNAVLFLTANSSSNYYAMLNLTPNGTQNSYIRYGASLVIDNQSGVPSLTITSTGAATFSSGVTAYNGIFNGISTVNLKVQNGANANALVLIQSFGSEAAGENASIMFKSAANNTDTTYAKGLISFVNNGTGYGRGNLVFSINNDASSTNVSTLDAKLTLDSSGNLGLGVTPSAWDSGQKVIQVGLGAFYGLSDGGATVIVNNAYYNSGWKYSSNSSAGLYQIVQNSHQWYNTSSGTAGNAITFTQAMTLTANGDLIIGSGADTGESLQVTGKGKFTDTVQFGSTAGYTTATQGGFFSKGGGEIYIADILAGAADLKAFTIQRNDVKKFSIGLNVSDNLAFLNSSDVSVVNISSTGAATFSSSVAAPNVYVSTNNGMYDAGTNSVGLQTNGVARLIISSTGNVGIGTTTPSSKLEVRDGNIVVSSSNDTAIQINRAGNTIAYLGDVGAGGNNAGELLLYDSAGNLKTLISSTGSRSSYISEGNVGIGTNNPSYTLDVQAGSSTFRLRSTSNSNTSTFVMEAKNSSAATKTSAISFSPDSQNLVFSADGFISNMVVSASGNVGIGTAPRGKLDVDGYVYADGLLLDGAFTTSSATTDAGWNNVWKTIIPVNTLTTNATYIVSFTWNNGSSGQPYELNGAGIITTANTNGSDTGTEVSLASISHTGGTADNITIRQLCGSGQVCSGLQIRLVTDNSLDNGTLSAKASRIC